MYKKTITFERTQDCPDQLPIEMEITHDGTLSDQDVRNEAFRKLVEQSRNEALFGVIFQDINYPEAYLCESKFTGCRFKNCDFTDSAVSWSKFLSCCFSDCVFVNSLCNEVSLDNSRFDNCNFYKANLNHSSFLNCTINGGNFVEAELSDVIVKGSDLLGPESAQSLINKGITTFPPSVDFIHQKVLHNAKIGGLDMGDFHTCDTTHCIAGWAIHLAGDKGYYAEQKLDPENAGAMIYLASDRQLEKIPNFYTDDESAMRELEYLAAKEIEEKGIWDGTL